MNVSHRVMALMFGFTCLFILLCAPVFCKGYSGEHEESQCPEKCSCANSKVICRNSLLDYIPALPSDTKYLDFSENQLLDIVNTTFHNISTLHIQELNLSSCDITAISENAFSSLPTIESLDLSNNLFYLSELKEGLKRLKDSKLRSLILDSQKLPLEEELPVDLFDSLYSTHLQNLSLVNNGIYFFNGTVFSKLRFLEVLNLSDNYLSDIEFQEMQSLTALDVSKNELISIPKLSDVTESKCFVPLLKVLILDDNHISNIGLDAECLTMLETLSANYNPIGVFLMGQFASFKSLKTLYLDFLMIRRLRLDGNAFSSHTLRHLRLGVIRHEVTTKQLNIFDNCSSLQTLRISGFELGKLADQNITKLFSPILNLKLLKMKSAALSAIPSVISSMKRLGELGLQENFIRQWSSNTFSGLNKLNILNLANNKISVINSTSFPWNFLEQVKSMKLTSNPYACTCDNYWFIQWAKLNNNKLRNQFPYNFECFSPPSLNGRPMSMYNPTYLQCHGLEQYQLVILASGAVLLILFISFAIYKRYKWHLRYYMYLIRSKKEKEANNLLSDTNFKYDAFVAYTSEDRSWVISNLMAVLEGEHKFRLCLHERDFLPGRTILDQISETIKHSRKVILVLSTNFAKSLWCQYEILLAQNRLMEDGGNALILILLDEIKGKYMTNCLGMLLKTVTYVRWTTNNEGRKLFWNKVTMSMKT